MNARFNSILLLVLSLGYTSNCVISAPSERKNYLAYYDLINEAERQFFIEVKPDSALHYYDYAFKTYEYVFINDLLNAAQISIHSGKGDYKVYLSRAFNVGLQFKHLQHFEIFEPLLPELLADTLFVEEAEVAVYHK